MARNGVGQACLGILAAYLSLFAGEPAADPSTVLRVATLNVAHGRGLAYNQTGLPPEAFERNLEALARVVRREAPEVLAIQEADGPSAWSAGFDHVAWLAQATAFEHVYHGVHFKVGAWKMGVEYGTALLARRPLLSPASLRFRTPLVHTKGFVLAEVELEGRPLVVTSVHLESGSAAIRRVQVDMIVNALTERAKPVVLMGDLNSRWENESDAVRLLAARLHLRAYRPEDPGLGTFRSTTPRTRIDWILISEKLEFVDYAVWPDQVSDHLGVAASLRWRP